MFYRYSPFGITSMIAASILSITDIVGAMTSLGWLVVCLVIGCLVHQFVLHLLYFAIVRKNPFKFSFKILDGMLAGFSVTTRYLIKQHSFTKFTNILLKIVQIN